MKNKIVKGITLIMFSTLILGFVAFRSGSFGGQKVSYSVSPNGSALNNQIDTFPKVDTLTRINMLPYSLSSTGNALDKKPLNASTVNSLHTRAMMSSSKVLIIRDQSSPARSLMPSSKIGPMMRKDDLNKLKRDTMVPDIWED